MNGGDSTGDDGIGQVTLLVFTIMGVRIAVDVEQIAEMLDPGEAEEGGLTIRPFHELVPFRTPASTYASPKVLLLKDERITDGILIDQPEDILTIGIDAILPLPDFLRKEMRLRAVWGAFLMEDEVVLLADFHEIFSPPGAAGISEMQVGKATGGTGAADAAAQIPDISSREE